MTELPTLRMPLLLSNARHIFLLRKAQVTIPCSQLGILWEISSAAGPINCHCLRTEDGDCWALATSGMRRDDKARMAMFFLNKVWRGTHYPQHMGRSGKATRQVTGCLFIPPTMGKAQHMPEQNHLSRGCGGSIDLGELVVPLSLSMWLWLHQHFLKASFLFYKLGSISLTS